MPIDRRKFLIGTGALAAGGATALGTGAFSRVESQRAVSIEVATDANAYLGFKDLDTPNSSNYVGYDDGHIFIDIGKHDDFEAGGGAAPGEGVNSDSFTYFDGMFLLCNQGKADATIKYELPDPPEGRNIEDDWGAPDPDYDEQVVGFYYIADEEDEDPAGTRVFVEEGQEVPLPLGECVEMGVRTVTKGVDATIDAPLIDGEALVTAVSEDAGST